MRAGRGFTLIEMVVVVAIVGLLVAAAVPLQEVVLRRAQEQALRDALRTLRGALDEHRRAVLDKRIAPGPDGTPWPPSLDVLVTGIPLVDEQGQPRPGGARLYLLRRLPRDPFADRALPAAETWNLRASSALPGQYGGGKDVFDVASRSEAVALDGSRVADW